MESATAVVEDQMGAQEEHQHEDDDHRSSETGEDVAQDFVAE